MGQIVNYNVGFKVNLMFVYTENGVGVSGLNIRVALRDVISGKYLDFSDNMWKSVGWSQKYVVLQDKGNGLYEYIWDSWPAVKDVKVVIAEYEVLTSDYEANDFDVLTFGLTEIIESGRWKIENNQMKFYGPDGTTPVLIFNLFNKLGLPAEVNVVERVRI